MMHDLDETLRGLDSLTTPDVWDEAIARTPSPPRPQQSRHRVLTAVVALAIFAGAGVIVWSAFRDGPTDRAAAWPSGYPSPPSSGYWIVFPDEAVPGVSGSAPAIQVTALTNLPEGTVYSVATDGDISCCPSVRDGRIDVSINDLGQIVDFDTGTKCSRSRLSNLKELQIAITVGPDRFLQNAFLGEGPRPQQPDSVNAILGEDFQNLSGDQVEEFDGAKQLEARTSYPVPPCESDPGV